MVAQRTRQTQPQPAASLAVLDYDAGQSLCYASGADGGTVAIPLRGTLDAAALLRWMETRSAAQCWLTASYAAAMDMKVPGWRVSTLGAARAQGWQLDVPELTSWAHAYRPGTFGSRELAIQPADRREPFGAAANGQELYGALTRYAQLVGLPFRRSPGATGTALMRATHAGDALQPVPMERWPEPALDSGLEAAFNWCEAPSGEPRSLLAIDKNGAFLSAAGMAKLGVGEPRYVSGAALREAVASYAPGYYRVELDGQRIAGLPDPFQPDAIRASRTMTDTWMAAPSLQLAHEIGAALSVVDAYVWPRSMRVLEPWYKRLRDARAALLADPEPAAAVALGVVKQTYAQAIGWLDGRWLRSDQATTRDLHRPDWRHTIIALARANCYRRLLAARFQGAEIIGVAADCAYVTSSEATHEAAAPAAFHVGAGLGDYKVKVIEASWARAALRGMRSGDVRERTRAFMGLQQAFREAGRGGDA